MPRRKDEIGVGLGPNAVPYARGGSMLDPAQQAEAMKYLQGNQQPEEEVEDPSMGAPPTPEAGAGILGGVATPAAAPTSDQLSNEQLAAMSGDQQDPQVAQVLAALEDPSTPPETKQRIEMMISMAARRRMAGIQA